jgi:hypothetical protein
MYLRSRYWNSKIPYGYVVYGATYVRLLIAEWP